MAARPAEAFSSDPPPEFSVPAGFYDEPIELEISYPLPGASINLYYTLDGSVPDTTSAVFEAPILIEDRTPEPNNLSEIPTSPPEANNYTFGWEPPDGLVDKATVVRAVAYNAVSGQYSEVATATYFISIEDNGLAVVSLSTDPGNFFDHEIGIYIPGLDYELNGYGSLPWGSHGNYRQRGREWERPVHIEWLENGELMYRNDAGVRIHGSGSRVMPMKSLRLYARSDYGDNRFRYPFFGENYDASFNRLLLRGSGQDFSIRSTMFRDAFMQGIFGDMAFSTQNYRPTVVFLNGEYWGIHNLRERYDRHYIERTYNVDPENIDLLERNGGVQEGSNEDWVAFMSFLYNNDLADPEDYAYATTVMDTQNMLDYFIAQIYVRNTDWPGNNKDYWRYNGAPDSLRPETDGRWRYMLLDTDFGFGLNQGDGNYEHNTLAHATFPDGDSWPNPEWSTRVLRTFLNNETFRNKFIQQFSDMLNTRFRPDYLISVIDEMEAVIDDEMHRHIARWQKISNHNRWKQHVQIMRDFAMNRPEYQWMHLRDHFDLGDTYQLEIDVNDELKGHVGLNSIIIHENTPGIDASDVFPWSGEYFNGVPVTLTAYPIAGYRFTHWEVNGTEFSSDQIEIVPEGDHSVTAFFELDEEFIDNVFPAPFTVSDNSYTFTNWAPDSEPGSFPESMAFIFMDQREPVADAEKAGITTGAYDLESRTRINGLGDNGFSFINTGNEEGNPGFPGTRLGGALLALDTRDAGTVTVGFTAGTVLQNSRVYNLRLEYRIGDEGPFFPVLKENNSEVIYMADEQSGHTQTFTDIQLPQYLSGRPYIQLLWRYYYSGIRLDEESGARSQLNISETIIESNPVSTPPVEIPDQLKLNQNYPNPFNTGTIISFSIPEQQEVQLQVYDIQGRLIATLLNERRQEGLHRVSFNGAGLASGVYIYVLRTPDTRLSGTMLLLK